jgi:hypothetical protein
LATRNTTNSMANPRSTRNTGIVTCHIELYCVANTVEG